MPKLYRDAATGHYTTAEDAAARPAETVAETVEAHHETPDVAELRRLYEAAMCVDANEMAWDEWTTAISEAADALLDEADRLAHMTEARNNARAEVERLTALVEAVREYAAARQANIDHGPLLSARKAAHDALLAALARLDEEPQP